VFFLPALRYPLQLKGQLKLSVGCSQIHCSLRYIFLLILNIIIGVLSGCLRTLRYPLQLKGQLKLLNQTSVGCFPDVLSLLAWLIDSTDDHLLHNFFLNNLFGLHRRKEKKKKKRKLISLSVGKVCQVEVLS